MAAALIVLSGCAPSLAAAPHLVAGWPLDGARLAVTSQTLDLTFNRALRPTATWAAVASQDADEVLRTRASVDQSDARRLQIRIFDPTAGTFDVHWHAVAEESGAVADGTRRLTFQAQSPAPARIDVSPGLAEAGDRLELVGKGFARNSSVTLTIGDEAQPLTTTSTDASGKFNLEARVPPTVPLGVQPVVASDGDANQAIGSVEVRWGGWPPVRAFVVGEPGPDPSEVTFSVTVQNLSDYVLEHVRIVLADPEGTTLVGFDSDGRRQAGSLVWEIPVLDRGVVGPLRATYRASSARRQLVSHAQLEFRHRAERGCTGGSCLPAFISSTTADSVPVTPAD
jgi:methionine-rich copper-binding protein CopC